ncbi:putative ABC transport system permease protein [Hamadaea flava]|uniref:ABC transporter permease n=1 Tax=Hamadaea flava TaxID=1742688 RepID=A0ABV8LUE9_9ACTN|nr:ABC transporter permease [Hamadaea flava]MCP2327048.1 putative ABC transport system permease protein [Hamadaea flava]
MRRFSGRLRSALIIGVQGIRARKTRTLLSIVSLFLGVLAVVVVQAGAETANRAALANIELMMGKDGTIQMWVPDDKHAISLTLDTLKGRTDAVGALGVSAIIGEPGVNPINPGGAPLDQPYDFGPQGRGQFFCDAQGYCKEVPPQQQTEQMPTGAAIELSLTGLTGDVRPFRPYQLVAGLWLDFTGPPSLAPRVVVNKAAAIGFGRYQIPAEMRIRGAKANPTPRIIGVVDDGRDQPAAYVRADELTNWVPTTTQGLFGGMEVLRTPDAHDVEQILKRRLLADGLTSDQISSNMIQSKKEIEGQLAMFRLIFLGIAGLVLLIGIAGILNVGLATVGERVEEFALRRAVGTPRSLLAGIVLAETLLTGLFTAAAAIGVASVCLKIVGRILGGREPVLAHMDFPWQAGLAGILAGLVAGLLGGLIPAIRAARIPIATVMRA